MAATTPEERMRLVIVGHVDHGKSTVIGRLLADTGSLPEGKLEQVRRNCERNAKPFEYAFLLDALHDEQDQGITIDSARCFFRTDRRYYIVIDAPGHIEFLKNMVTGAANAEAALVVIDAQEGIRENTRRHGYLVSMLGVRQVVVVVNKMDLAGFRQEAFEAIKQEYGAFLAHLNLTPLNFIPVSARHGENMVEPSEKMPWYDGLTVIRQLDALEKASEDLRMALPFRFPVQDIYKFTEAEDDRRILAGTIETGVVHVGDEVAFLPSRKTARIVSVEQFSAPVRQMAHAGQSIGLTIDPQIYLKPGELMVRPRELQPHVSSRFRASIFWMGHAPLIQDRPYKLKLAAKSIGVRLVEVLNIVDASDLESVHNKQQVDRHDVGECIFETVRPIAFDLARDLDQTGRFVLVDQYEIAGGGIVLEALPEEIRRSATETALWDRSPLSPEERARVYRHRALCVVVTGEMLSEKRALAKQIENTLVHEGAHVYYLGPAVADSGGERQRIDVSDDREEQIRQLGEKARLLMEAGQVFVTALDGVDDYDLKQFRQLIEPCGIVVINIGQTPFQQVAVDLNIVPGTADAATPQVCDMIRRRMM